MAERDLQVIEPVAANDDQPIEARIIDAKFKVVRRSDADWERFSQRAERVAVFALGVPLTIVIIVLLDPILRAVIDPARGWIERLILGH